MAGKIVIGNNNGEHGIFVAQAGKTVEQGAPYLMSSVGDMLKIWAQGSVASTASRQSLGLWRHDITVNFPELPYIPLAFMGFKTSSNEPFQFPPDLYTLMTWNGATLGDLMPAIGIAHNKLAFAGWTEQQYAYFNYTVFLLKIRDRF